MELEFKKLIANSQSKYYNFKVAAILECNDGTLFKGVNIETSSPAGGCCAERVALFSALTSGKNKIDFKKIYVYNETEKFCRPCFICRQALNDYCSKNLEIVSYNKNFEKSSLLLEELCPYQFSEDDLK